MLPQQGPGVQFLVGELRSCMPQSKKFDRNWLKKICDEQKIKIKKKMFLVINTVIQVSLKVWWTDPDTRSSANNPGGGADRAGLGRSKPRRGLGVERHLGKDRMGKSGASAEGRVQDRDQNLNDVEITPVAIKMGVKNTNKELSFANKRFWLAMENVNHDWKTPGKRTVNQTVCGSEWPWPSTK